MTSGLIVDAGPLYSQADRSDPDHAEVVRVLRAERGSLIVPAFAAAEADYLILTRLGTEAEVAFLKDLAEGTYRVECPTRSEMEAIVSLANLYRELRLGLSDLAVVVLAGRFKTRRLLTLDERHFRAVSPIQGGRFTLLPAES